MFTSKLANLKQAGPAFFDIVTLPYIQQSPHSDPSCTRDEIM